MKGKIGRIQQACLQLLDDAGGVIDHYETFKFYHIDMPFHLIKMGGIIQHSHELLTNSISGFVEKDTSNLPPLEDLKIPTQSQLKQAWIGLEKRGLVGITWSKDGYYINRIEKVKAIDSIKLLE